MLLKVTQYQHFPEAGLECADAAPHPLPELFPFQLLERGQAA
jgi:hypothetical protein